MRFIQELSQETTRMLSRIYRQSKHFEVRRRSHCILLSFEGFTTTGLMVLFNNTPDILGGYNAVIP